MTGQGGSVPSAQLRDPGAGWRPLGSGYPLPLGPDSKEPLPCQNGEIYFYSSYYNQPPSRHFQEISLSVRIPMRENMGENPHICVYLPM